MTEYSDPSNDAGAELAQWNKLVRARAKQIAAFQKTPQFALQWMMASDGRTFPNVPELLNHTKTIPGVPVIISPDESMKIAPSLVVGSFDTSVEAFTWCKKIARSMDMLYRDSEPVPNEFMEHLKQIVDDDGYVSMKRILINPRFTDGFEIFAFHTMIYREDITELPNVTLITRPGRSPSPILHIPTALLHGLPPPPLGVGEEKITAEEFARATKMTKVPRIPRMLLNVGIIIAFSWLLSKCAGQQSPSGERKPGVFESAWEESKQKIQEETKKKEE